MRLLTTLQNTVISTAAGSAWPPGAVEYHKGVGTCRECWYTHFIHLNYDFQSWFTGCCLNEVEHPTYGKHQCTPIQIIRGGRIYRKALLACIRKHLQEGNLTEEKVEEHS